MNASADAQSFPRRFAKARQFSWVVECPVCPDLDSPARDEGTAWILAQLHDEFEGHDAGTAYVVTDCQG